MSRDSRASSSVTYRITGPGQKHQNNWIQALRSASFKESLIEFCANSWEDDNIAHKSYVSAQNSANSGDVCYGYKVVNGRVVRTVEDALYNDHEEANSQCFTMLQMFQLQTMS